MKQPEITIYFNPTCPHCHHALEFFATELPDIVLKKIELNGQPGKNRIKFEAGLEMCHLGSRGIPLIIVGKKCFQGFDEQVGEEIKSLVVGS
jgi:glutaredoxin